MEDFTPSALYELARQYTLVEVRALVAEAAEGAVAARALRPRHVYIINVSMDVGWPLYGPVDQVQRLGIVAADVLERLELNKPVSSLHPNGIGSQG